MRAIILIIAVILLLISACRPARVLTRYETTEIETRVRDIPVTLRVPPVIISQGVIIDTLKPDQSVLETEFCFSRIYWADGLQHELQQKEARVDTVIEVREVTTTQTIKEPYEVRYQTWWDKLWIRIGWVSVTSLLIYILWRRIIR